MKVIIDPYRGGVDTGKIINYKYEKNLLLDLSKYLSCELNKLSVETELVRFNDITLSYIDRIDIIKNIIDKDDIVIQNRLSFDNQNHIVFSINDNVFLSFLINNNLEKNNIKCNYYFINNFKNSIIIFYNDIVNYEKIIKIISKSIKEYVINNKDMSYI